MRLYEHTPTTGGGRAVPNFECEGLHDADGRAPFTHEERLMKRKVTSVENYFETLEDRFNPDGAKGVDMTFQWEIDGKHWNAAIKDQKMTLNEGETDSATCTLHITGENFVKMINGDLNEKLAVLTRKLKVTGNKLSAGKVRRIFPIE